MTDFFIKGVPLPVSRPSGINPEYQPSIDAGMPFKATEKLTDAFFDTPRYHPTSDPLKPLSELPRGSETLMEKIHEMNVQFYGWDSGTPLISSTTVEIIAFFFAMGFLTIVLMIIWTAIKLFVEWVVGNKD